MSTMRGRIGLWAMGSENKLWPGKGECSRVSAPEGLPDSENDRTACGTFEGLKSGFGILRC